MTSYSSDSSDDDDSFLGVEHVTRPRKRPLYKVIYASPPTPRSSFIKVRSLGCPYQQHSAH